MGFKGQLVLALALNIALKAFTFALNTLLTRLLLPEQSGIGFSYTVYVDSVLFLAREAVRNTASRVRIYEESRQKVSETGGGGDEDHPTAETTSAPASEPSEDTARISQAGARQLVHLGFLAVPIALASMLLLEVVQGVVGIHVLPSLYHTARGHAIRPEDNQGGQSTSTGAAASTLLGKGGGLLHHAMPELLVAGSVLLSAAVEPCVVLAQALDLYRVVVLAEFTSLMARLLTTIALVKYSTANGWAPTSYSSRLIFAIGQLTYSLAHATYCIVLCSSAVGTGTRVAALARRTLAGSASLSQACRAAEEQPGQKQEHEHPQDTRDSLLSGSQRQLPFPLCVFSPHANWSTAVHHLTLLRTFFAESTLRLVLTEGEGFALASVGSAAARGYFQLVSNLGSLVARLVFRVWENACFVRWSRDVAAGAHTAAVTLLVFMLRVSFYFSFAFVLLGPPFSALLLQTLYAARWATPGTVRALQLYCYAVPCMAWNGLLEAFLRAVASPATLHRQQRVMFGLSLLYVAVCYAGLTMTSSGATAGDAEADSAGVAFLILANMANMVVRTGYSVSLLLTTPSTTPSSSCSSLVPAGASVLTWKALREAVPPLQSPVLAAFLVAMLAATRMTSPSVISLAGFTVVYAVVVLLLDEGLRGVLHRIAGPVLARMFRGKETSTS